MTTERKDETMSQDMVPESDQAVPAGGPRIVVNPKVFSDNRDATCVAWNEAFRIVMEENEFNPQSEPTDDQRRFFSDTAYADDEVMLRRTILARICTFDTSVKDPTDEQIAESAEFLETVMQIGAPQSQEEQTVVQRVHDILLAAISKGEGRPAGGPPQGGSPRGEPASEPAPASAPEEGLSEQTTSEQ